MKKIIFTNPTGIDYIEGEQWRVAAGYAYYMVSNYGRVYSFKQDKLMKFDTVTDNYLSVELKCNDGVFRHVRVHRLVAQVFINNPENKPEVHHIDCNRQNNKADNLMWCTKQEHTDIHRRLKEQAKQEQTEKAGGVNE